MKRHCRSEFSISKTRTVSTKPAWLGLSPWTRPSTPPSLHWPLLMSLSILRLTSPSATWLTPPTPSQGCPTAFLPLVLGPALLLQEADASSAISCLALGDREGHRCRIFPRLWEPIFTQAMSSTRTPKNFTKNTIFMPQFWPGDVKMASRRCQTRQHTFLKFSWR